MSGYGGPHQAIRRAGKPYAYGTPCGRCGELMMPGQPIDLDHTDDRAGYRGFAHARCNRRAGGRLGAARLAEQRKERRPMATEVVLGVEIAEDRRHTSIVAASVMPDDCALIDLIRYLDGPDAVPALVELNATRTVLGIVIDPHSPAATLIGPLTEAGITVTTPSTSEVVVAHGAFLDLVSAGKLRHTGQPQLDAAVRNGAQRPLGGAAAWARRGIAVDVSPLTAATLAVWWLRSRPAPQPFFATRR